MISTQTRGDGHDCSERRAKHRCRHHAALHLQRHCSTGRTIEQLQAVSRSTTGLREKLLSKDMQGRIRHVPEILQKIARCAGHALANEGSRQPFPCREGLSAAGKKIRNKLPRRSSLASSIRPPFASIAQRAIARPSPTPPSSLERLASTR